MKQYLVAYINRKGEITTTTVYATSGSDALHIFHDILQIQGGEVIAVSLID